VTDLVRVGVIGTGFGASTVAPAFDATDDCTVVDVVTPRDDSAVASLCARSDVDLISVHSPPFLHVEHVCRAIEAGHAVHCDKPFGLDADESATMTELAKEAGIVNLLNFERRFDPGRERLRALLHDGAIGDPNHFQYSRFIAAPGRPYTWLCSNELGGGWLAGQGSHLIDCCRWLFGEIVEAVAVLRTALTERPDADGQLHRCDADDGFVASLRTATDVTAVIDCSLETPVSTPERMAVFGSAGMLELDDDGIVLRAAEGDVETYEIDLQGKVPLILSMERWAGRICDAVRTGVVQPGWPTFDDGLACAVVMDRMGR
jgi:predicted dehydrogenase